jgi:hypothetical protein
MGIWIHELNLARAIDSFSTGDIFSSVPRCPITNRDASAVIEAHNLIVARTMPRHRIERHPGALQTVPRATRSDDDQGNN